MDKKEDILRQHLFSEERLHAYVVLDGAAIPDLLDKIEEHNPFHVCLFRGDDDPEIAEVAPYLVRLEADTPFADWMLGEGRGKHWGIFALVPEETPFIDLRQHFRDMTRVRLPDGKTVFFRYYDPRTCNTFLPTCDQEQLREFFGVVHRYLVENKSEGEESVEFIAYSLNMGTLDQQRAS